MSSAMYKSKFRVGDMVLGRILMVPFEMFLRNHLRNTISISLLGSGIGRADGLGGAL